VNGEVPMVGYEVRGPSRVKLTIEAARIFLGGTRTDAFPHPPTRPTQFAPVEREGTGPWQTKKE